MMMMVFFLGLAYYGYFWAWNFSDTHKSQLDITLATR
jgi:hypothetical protein